MRLALELLIWIVALTAVAGAAWGLRGAFPAFFGLVRVLLHPGVLLGLLAIVFLLRLGYPRRSKG